MRVVASLAGMPPALPSLPTLPARGQWPSVVQCLTGKEWPPPSPCSTAPIGCGSTKWTPKSYSTSLSTQTTSGTWSLRGRPRQSTRCPRNGPRTARACAGGTPSTPSSLPEPPPTTAMRCCTRRTKQRPRTPSCRTHRQAPATPSYLSPAMSATLRCGPHHVDALCSSPAGATQPRVHAVRAHPLRHGPRHGLYPRTEPQSSGPQPPGSAS